MTPAARTQALIELVGQLIGGGKGQRLPADRLLQRYFRARRYIGGGDRRALSDDFYGLLRSWELCRWRLSAAGADATARHMAIAYTLAEGRAIAELFTDEPYAPGALTAAEQELVAKMKGLGGAPPEYACHNCPKWAEQGMRQRFGEDFGAGLDALNVRAPAVIRANRLKIARGTLAERLKAEGIVATPTATSPHGLAVEGDANARASASYKEGLFEFQDEGSQIAALLLGAGPGMQVCDYCAGTGGKTLVLAAEMQNRGQIFACDVAAGRLKRLARRLQRAGVRNTQTVRIGAPDGPPPSLPRGGFARVIVDAPCSGNGSWRRQPELRIGMDSAGLAKLTALQDRILDQAITLVAPDGVLLFVTCSLLPVEGEERIAHFLSRHEAWQLADPLAGLEGPNLPQFPARRGMTACRWSCLR